MITWYFVSAEGADIGEAEGFYTEKGNLIHWWARNDASWRGEYLDPLLKHLGVTIVYDNKKLNKKFYKFMKDWV